MDADEAKRLLFAASKVRVPTFDDDASAAVKVPALEDFMLGAAGTRGDLEEAKLWMSELLHGFTKEWYQLVGWESNLPGGKKRKDATKEDINEAKRSVRPDLWELISDLKHLIAELASQIRRIEIDEKDASRAYAMVVGE